ncbi:PD-(D/E)XK nuclease-like domain-containing protein [Elizabethkingia anophelis]|uniref:PD-(D/E)XK nuclease-like domain-containing protein n=1 Tax=Elizabethkingia anophelis TaxID=1117645 RepID=UPI001318DD2F|nr:PD-(D/E)XK nuclease-like domain-containing protein [Elizabethkingia anophelis]BBQ09293.1 hypothetical protein JUNP353_3864 [Elizabethkingia anophelis]
METKTASKVLKEAVLSPKDILIQKLINKTLTMSYSKLKNLTSPVNFMNALLEPKVKNDGMTIGTIVDCLLLTEEKFKEQFTIINIVPTTDMQKSVCNHVIRVLPKEYTDEKFNKIFSEAYSEYYAKGKPESLHHLIDYIKSIHSGKECISKDDYEKALKIVETLKNADDVMNELCVCEEFQKKIEFEFMGWKFIGFLDTWAPSIFHDLKYVSNLNPDKFKWEIEKYEYELQIGSYATGLEILGLSVGTPKFKFITYDDKGNYSILEVETGYIDYCKRKFEYYVMRLNKMVHEMAFDKSYDFFKSKNVIYKPAYAPGFDHTIFNQE